MVPQAVSGTNQHHCTWANDTNMYKIALLVKIFDINFFKMVMLPRHTSIVTARTQNYKATSESAYTACGKLLVQQYKNLMQGNVLLKYSNTYCGVHLQKIVCLNDGLSAYSQLKIWWA